MYQNHQKTLGKALGRLNSLNHQKLVKLSGEWIVCL
jgi:hypothetical protein